MKSGETRFIVKKLDTKKPYNSVGFRLSNGKTTIKKSTDAEDTKDKVLVQDGVFLIPLQQADTNALQGNVTLEAQINYQDHSVIMSDDNFLYINSSLGYDAIQGSAPAEDDGIEVVMTAIEEGVAVIVNPESAEELITRVTKLFQDTKAEADEVYEAYQRGDLNGKDGVDGKDGKDGVDGKDGTDGRDGTDGYSPTIDVKTQTQSDYVLTIKDKNKEYDTPNLVGPIGPQGVQGVQGIQGPTGDAFAIYKTYTSIADMNADAPNVPEGKFVMITSNVEDPDNAKLYVKGESSFSYITDMSGATGMKGDTGEQGVQGEQGEPGVPGPKGDRGDGTVTDTAKGSTISLTDSADSPLDAISIMGKSTQNGTPTIDAPIPIVDITQEEIEITNGTDTQSATLTKTLRGIPVLSGGNYTDNNNQQWLCDTIERYKDGSGKYIQRVGVLTLDGTENISDLSNNRVNIRQPQLPNSTQSSPTTLFSIMRLAPSQSAVGTNDNTYIVATGNLVTSPTSNGQRLTAEQFKTYLASNNATLEYLLDTPIETPLTSEELAELNLDTYYPSTTITANTDVVVEYVCDTKTLLDKKQNKLTAGQNITIQDDVISASGELSTDYNEATNKPQINSTTLSGNKTSSDLGLQDKLTAGTNITIDANNVISASGGGLSYTFTNGLTESSGTVGIDLKSGTELQITNGELDIDLSDYATQTDLADKQDTIDSNNKLDADLVNDSNSTNKFVPTSSSADNGKFLRVVNGVATWDTVANAEGSSY